MLTVLRFICYVAHTPATLCASEIGNGPMKILEAECEERKRMPLERSIFEVGKFVVRRGRFRIRFLEIGFRNVPKISRPESKVRDPRLVPI
jgi:hypothetical protein